MPEKREIVKSIMSIPDRDGHLLSEGRELSFLGGHQGPCQLTELHVCADRRLREISRMSLHFSTKSPASIKACLSNAIFMQW